MMLLKCCTQYTSKFGKPSSGYRTGKGQFSFQQQRRAMPKNVQTTTQLHSFHMLVRSYSKSFKLRFKSMWTKKFQMYKLDLEKAEEPEIKLPTFIGSQKKQGTKNITCISVNKECCGRQAFSHSSHSQWCTLREAQDGGKLALDI